MSVTGRVGLCLGLVSSALLRSLEDDRTRCRLSLFGPGSGLNLFRQQLLARARYEHRHACAWTFTCGIRAFEGTWQLVHLCFDHFGHCFQG